jgi:voltage-gated sodium channel
VAQKNTALNTSEKRSIADRLFAFFTNEIVMSVAITLSTVFVFLSGYKLKSNIFLYLDAFFTIFFLIEAIVKITCSNPGPGKSSLKEKFHYYWYGKYDLEKQKEKRMAKGDDIEEDRIKAYRNKQDEKRKEKEKKQKKGPIRKYILSFFFCDDGETSHWNQFDFIVTLIALPSLLNFFQEADVQTTMFLSLRSLRVFRALRIAKAARIMRYIPDIDKLFQGLKAALKSCFVVVMGFIVLMLITSILSSTLFGEIAPEYFGNPGQSLYSTFRLFTIEGWFEIPDVIAARSTKGMGMFAKIYFSIFLFSGGIIGVSLINSFFVDAMAEDNNEDVLIKLEEMEKMMKEMQDQINQKEEKNGQSDNTINT